MEYRLELRHSDGGREEVCDPGNPVRAPGAFGEKSVVEFPGYAPPGWLDAPRVDGTTTDLTIPSRLLGADVLPVFSPDCTKLMWTSNRDGRSPTQLYIADFVMPK